GGGQYHRAGVVRAAREPRREHRRADALRDPDSQEAVLDRPTAYPRVRIADAAEAVVVVLEQRGAHGADSDAPVLGKAPQLAPVVDPLPQDVDGPARAAPRPLVDQRALRHPLPAGPAPRP